MHAIRWGSSRLAAVTAAVSWVIESRRRRISGSMRSTKASTVPWCKALSEMDSRPCTVSVPARSMLSSRLPLASGPAQSLANSRSECGFCSAQNEGRVPQRAALDVPAVNAVISGKLAMYFKLCTYDSLAD